MGHPCPVSTAISVSKNHNTCQVLVATAIFFSSSACHVLVLTLSRGLDVFRLTVSMKVSVLYSWRFAMAATCLPFRPQKSDNGDLQKGCGYVTHDLMSVTIIEHSLSCQKMAIREEKEERVQKKKKIGRIQKRSIDEWHFLLMA